jgi:integrase/recombinase XerD
MTEDLSQHLADYLALRRSMGHKLDDAARLLPGLVAHCDDAGVESLTVEVMLAWAQQPAVPAGSTVHARRMTAARGFARYLSGIDPGTQVPPAGLISSRRPRTTPHIYSDAEVAALLAVIPMVVVSPFKARTFRMVIGLLACTGMRIGEVLALHDTDIDEGARTLLVRESKFGKSRLVPVHATTMTEITSYRAERDRVLPARRDANLLVSNAGTALIYTQVGFEFRRMLDAAGVGMTARRRSRLHDFRHTFAVRTLADWYAGGDDVAARLPVLSTYLGHRDPRSTYWYLTATPELLAHAAGMLAEHGQDT